MRAYFDTEHVMFKSTPLTLASIGIVREDGAELYMVSGDFKRSVAGPWFKRNVWPGIAEYEKHSQAEIANAVSEFLSPVDEIVTCSGLNDFKILAELVGEFWFSTFDLHDAWRAEHTTVVDGKKFTPPMPKQTRKKHHALEDARWHRTLYKMTTQPELAAA